MGSHKITRYRDKKGKFHREEGKPAVIHPDGSKLWYWHGLLHRINGPAVIWSDGHMAWYWYGDRHRIDGPARILPNGKIEYWVDNRFIEVPKNCLFVGWTKEEQ